MKQARTTYEGVTRAMRGKVEVQVCHPLAEDVDVDEVGSGALLEYRRYSGEHCSQNDSLFATKVGEVRDVPLGFEVSEPGDW